MKREVGGLIWFPMSNSRAHWVWDVYPGSECVGDLTKRHTVYLKIFPPRQAIAELIGPLSSFAHTIDRCDLEEREGRVDVRGAKTWVKSWAGSFFESPMEKLVRELTKKEG